MAALLSPDAQPSRPDRPRRGGIITDENRRWWTLGAMCFALFMVMLDNTVVNVALPSIQKDLDVPISGLEWTVNAYTLTFAVLLVTGGRLGDIFGRRKVFLFGVVVFGLSSAFIALSQTDTWLITGRALQGVGAAFMMPATLSIITQAFPPEERGKAIGTWAGASAVALALGPVLGGFMVEHVSWQSIFLINVPIAIAAVFVTLWATQESRDETAPRIVDYWGIVTITVGLGALVLALVEGNAWGWDSARVLGLFVLSIVGIVGFVVAERRSPAPMVDFTFFRSRSYLGANVVAFIVSFAMLATFFFLALYLQNVRGYTPLEAGVRFLPSTAVIIVMGPVAGRLSDRVGPRILMTIGLVLTSISLFLQGHLAPDTDYAYLALAFVIMGMGMGLVMSPMSAAAMNAVDRTKAGVASGILSMSRMVGGTFGVAVMGALIATLGESQLDERLPAGTSAAVRGRLDESLTIGGGGIPGRAGDIVQQAFLDAVNTSFMIAAAVAMLGAVAAWVLVADKPTPQDAVESHHGLEGALVEAGDEAGTPQAEAALRAEHARA